MSCSKLDTIYRSFLLSKYFVKGWGKPQDLKRLLIFRKFISKQGSCFKLVPKNYPIHITKDYSSNNLRVIEGNFVSPLVMYLPELVPDESKMAYFQMVLPKKWKSNQFKPICLHMAGTGDQFYWRRRELLAKPLITEGGIASIILENPFYGLRKPKAQVRSILHNVSDIFVMGGCLMMEAIVLFRWCIENGFGPLGVTGISMGGHMASLVASCWPDPIVLVPCLSWSTASGVFTEGVMSRAINWQLLEEQFLQNDAYRREVISIVNSTPDAFSLNILNVLKQMPNIYKKVEKNMGHESRSLINSFDGIIMEQKNKGLVFNTLVNKGKNIGVESIVKSLPSLLKNTSGKVTDSIHKRHLDALNFMKELMDDCTHLRNFPAPVDISLIISICALYDGYVPRNGVTNLTQVWPGVEVRYLNAGHITAFIFHQKEFRDAIIEAFNRYREKYV